MENTTLPGYVNATGEYAPMKGCEFNGAFADEFNQGSFKGGIFSSGFTVVKENPIWKRAREHAHKHPNGIVADFYAYADQQMVELRKKVTTLESEKNLAELDNRTVITELNKHHESEIQKIGGYLWFCSSAALIVGSIVGYYMK